MNRNTARFVLGMMMGAVPAVMLAPGPAVAERSDCGSGKSCIWEDKYYDGQPFFERSDRYDYGTGWLNNDSASSVYNRSSVNTFRLYDNAGQDTSDGTLCFPRGYASKNLHYWGWGDRVSSMRINLTPCDPDNSFIAGGYVGPNG